MIPWTPDFNPDDFNLDAVFAEAAATRKSVYSLLHSAGYPVFKFVTDGPVVTEEAEIKTAGAESKAAGDGKPGLVTLIASTDALDLVGDVMEREAMEQMKAAAPGTMVFLNHSYRLPEDAFGTVVSADIVTKDLTNPLNGEKKPHLCLVYKVDPVSNEENPRGWQTYQMLAKGKRKLGASVTVLVLEKNEKTDGKRSIKKVFYIETSMVGVPCNQLSWAQHAAKAVNGDSPINSASKAVGEKPMSTELESKTAASSQPEVASKAAYADAKKDKTEQFWFMVETLATAIRKLKAAARQKQALDYAAELSATLAEFNADVIAAVLPTLQNTPADDNSYYYDYYSFFDPATGKITVNNISQKIFAEMGEITQKADAKDDEQDSEIFQKMHDHCCKMGAKCAEKAAEKGVSEAEAIPGVETQTEAELVEKSALEAVQASLTEKEAEIATLQARITELETANKSISEEATKWELAAHATAAKAMEMSQQPLPRIGQ